ncbi:transposase [Pelosinus baikalensis]|uniref:Transposase n=1 Tax=Pelosinus baikalensis TaxID=2892015 RepID=A0ABS8HV44_9FIRM|nr:transposase [Pelosinus baikalensis]
MSKSGKVIERNIKIAYVKQILENKMTTKQAAKELNVNAATVCDWVKKYRTDPENALPGSGHQKPDDEENRKLREKVKQLEAEVDFLKKATAYFASNHRKICNDKKEWWSDKSEPCMRLARSISYYRLLKISTYTPLDLLGIKICEIFNNSQRTYGVRRIKAALKNISINIGRGTIRSELVSAKLKHRGFRWRVNST